MKIIITIKYKCISVYKVAGRVINWLWTTLKLSYPCRGPNRNTSHGNGMLPQETSISCKHHVTNEEVCAKIQQAIGSHEDLLTIVKRCKLQCYGHVSYSPGSAKTILQGTVKGGRRQGRQRKRWEDNIREWTGLQFAKSQRAVEKREKWRKLDAKSSLVPQWPLQLRDRRATWDPAGIYTWDRAGI